MGIEPTYTLLYMMKSKSILRNMALVALSAIVMTACTKEDQIVPIYQDTVIPTPETTECSNYLVINNGDTLRFSRVIKMRQDQSNTTQPRNTNSYTFYAEGNLALEFHYVDMADLNDTVSASHDNSLVYLWNNGHRIALEDFAISICNHGIVHDISMMGTSAHGDTVKMHFCDTIIDLNQYTGAGSLITNNHEVELMQLAMEVNYDGEACYMLCNPTDSITYKSMRIEIRPLLNSGMYELEHNDIQVILWTGSDGQNSEHDAVAYPLTEGRLQFSDNEGTYSIICQGSCYLGDVSFTFNGTCLDNFSLPFTLTKLW